MILLIFYHSVAVHIHSIFESPHKWHLGVFPEEGLFITTEKNATMSLQMDWHASLLSYLMLHSLLISIPVFLLLKGWYYRRSLRGGGRLSSFTLSVTTGWCLVSVSLFPCLHQIMRMWCCCPSPQVSDTGIWEKGCVPVNKIISVWPLSPHIWTALKCVRSPS